MHRHGLLKDGDKILVAVSGGSDSLLMLHFLKIWKEKAPISFSLIPVYLDMGFDNGELWGIVKGYLSSMEMPYYMEQTRIGVYAHGPENRGKSPCFLCAWNRRKRLFQLTQVLRCNKIAFGHNLDDIIETFFMNICYSGEASIMQPRQEMFKGLITLIRPLCLVEKRDIDALARHLGLPVCKNPCPSSNKSHRIHIRDSLERLYESNSKIKGNIQRALSSFGL